MSAQQAFPFDYKRTLELVSGALFDAQATWQAWLPESGDWRKTALILTVPTIVAAMFSAWLIGLLTSDLSLFGGRPTLLSTLLSIVGAAAAIAVATFVFTTLAGVFGGKRDYALGFAALSLALVPAYVGQALSSLPWIGWLTALGLAIFGLVQLWRIIPLYLEVPQDKRVAHYVVSLLAIIGFMIVVSALIGPDEFVRPAGSAFSGLHVR